MNNLTADQIKKLNDVSDYRDEDLDLGTLIDNLITARPKPGTAVNAVAANIDATFAGVAIHGETFTIGDDIYEFLATASQAVSAVGNIPVDIQAYADKASVDLTVDTNPTAGDTMTIASKAFVFVPLGTANYALEIEVGATLEATQANIVAAINGTDGFNSAHTLVSAGAFAADVCIITAFIGGTIGNAYGATETFTAATNVFDNATLEDGVDTALAEIAAQLTAIITTEDTMGVSAEAAGGVVSLTADVAGVLGNSIAVSTDSANCTFEGGATTLEDGVDGTVGEEGYLLVDGSYLYVCTEDNAVSGANWRRISVGSVF